MKPESAELPVQARRIWLVAVVLTAYVLAGKLGLAFASVHVSASPVWPPTGIALAALLLCGLRFWPLVFLGAFLVNLTTAGTLITTAGIATGNTLEAVLAAYTVNKFAGGAACFDRAATIFRFAVFGALLAPVVSATLGVTSLIATGFAPWLEFKTLWLTWWLGDAVGALLVTPLIVLWWRERPLARARLPEALLMYGVNAIVAVVLFASPAGQYPLAFLCLPTLAWAAFRFTGREAATVVTVFSVIAIWATASGLGPFVMATPNESLLVVQAFIGTIALTMLPIAALEGQHRVALVDAQAASRAKDEFLALASHELRHPLQAMENAVALLRRAGVGQNFAVDTIARQCSHLARLVNDLLDVSSVIAGKVSLARKVLDLERVARQCTAEIRGIEGAKGHSVEIYAEPIWTEADPVRIKQIVANLVGNAFKYTPAGGRIEIRVKREDDTAVLLVSDNGIGIEPDVLPNVFDLFTQGASNPAAPRRGLGVGLTLVRRLVEQHGGTVVGRSAGPGKGSTFEVRLAVAEPPETTRSRPTAPISSFTAAG